MDHPSTLLIELPHLSDQSASELLDLLQQLFAGLDSHYYVQATRYQRAQREERERRQRDLFEPSDPPF
jgi:hypothetical protein